MARGIVPRQPAKTGRHEGTRAAVARRKPGNLAKTPLRMKATPKLKSVAGRPAKGYNPVAPERVSEILRRLDQLYPEATCALTHNSAWELLVATILSAQSTDANVNRVTPELFRKYPTVRHFAQLVFSAINLNQWLARPKSWWLSSAGKSRMRWTSC
jgi:hypothetical protein